jgi:hypothetical protein
MQRDQAHRTNELLERIAIALEKNNKVSNELVDATTKDIPGFEGVLNDLDNLYQPTSSNPDPAGYGNEDDDVQNDYLNDLVKGMNHIQYLNFHHDMAFGFASSDTAALNNHIYELEYEECLDAIKRALLITGDSEYIAYAGGDEEAGRNFVIERIKQENTTDPYADDPNLEVQMNQDKGFEDYHANLGKLNNNPPLHKDDPYTYDNDLNEYLDGVINDSDHDIRLTAKFYEDEYLKKEGATKKECILDYVTNEFGSHGARYSDITKFAYYLGAHNTPVKHNATRDRGYYSLALTHGNYKTGYLITGGTNQLVKGVNKEGNERYFALSEVESFTAYWKYLDR